MVSWIWLAIGMIFFYFSIVFFQYSRSQIRSFNLRQKQKVLLESEADTMELDEIKAVLSDFEQYLDSINSQNTNRARIAGIGFFLAGLASFIAAYIS